MKLGTLTSKYIYTVYI